MAVSVVTLAAIALAGEKHLTGTSNGNLYRDALHAFTFQKLDNWKFGKIDQEDPSRSRMLRTIVTQKNVTYPPDYIGNEDKFNFPFIGFFVDTSEMVLDAYAAEIRDRKSKRPSRRELAKDCPILIKGSYVDQTPTLLDGEKSIVQHYREDYQVQLFNRVNGNYKLKDDALLGDLYITKHGNRVFVFELTCEREIYRTVNEEAKKMIMSVDLDPPADSTREAGSGSSGQ